MTENRGTAGKRALESIEREFIITHQKYTSAKNTFSLFLVGTVLSLPVTPVIYYLADGNHETQTNILLTYASYVVITAFVRISIFFLKKRLNISKGKIESTGMRICCLDEKYGNSPGLGEKENILFIHYNEITQNHIELTPHDKIDFKEYDRMFTV